MTRTERMVCKAIHDGYMERSGFSDDSVASMVQFLVENKMLSPTRAQAWAARFLVRQLTRRGMGRMDAMMVVAEQMGLSFFTIRNYLYYNRK